MRRHFSTRQHSYIFIVIILIAFFLRTYNLNWDNGYHLHPDERMLIMVATRIDFFSNLNPDFFNYGSLPIYLLRGTSELLEYILKKPIATYDGMLIVGRILSGIFDTFTTILIYKISLALTKKRLFALFSSLMYAIAFFPVQNAHFFIVDPLLTFFITATMYQLILYTQEPTAYRLLKIALFSAAAITTKFTGILIIPIIGLGILAATFTREKSVKIGHSILSVLINGLLFTSVFCMSAFIFMPFGFIHHEQFVQEISQQLKMNSDPFIFPYTLQYVGTTPYWYYVKNIFLWGLGPVISLLLVFGTIQLVYTAYGAGRHASSVRAWITKHLPSTLYTVFVLLFFLILGRSAVKFMRYMLPLYPFFALLAGYGLWKLVKQQHYIRTYLAGASIFLAFIWTLLFVSIYAKPTTRVSASEWIYEHIPAGATLAVEHWDDRLPLNLPQRSTRANYQSSIYHFEELELYNPDTPEKWQLINSQLERSDYIIIASNRLYDPLQRLTKCDEVPEHRCYPMTSRYYEGLFNGTSGFEKVAEFTSFPGSIIDDSSADESFTVYDHPKIMIFRKSSL